MPLARKPLVRYDVAMSIGEGKRRRKGRKAALLTGAILFILFGMTVWFFRDHIFMNDRPPAISRNPSNYTPPAIHPIAEGSFSSLRASRAKGKRAFRRLPVSR